VTTALVWNPEAALYEEPDVCNADLAKRVARYPRLVPVPVANPRVRSAEAIVAKPGIPAVRLVPNYHAYRLTDDTAIALCRNVAARGLPVIVQMRIEDERNQYELLKVPGVPVEDIEALAARLPQLTIVVVCAYFREVARLAAVPNVRLDISFAESVDTLGALTEEVDAAKLLLGSHAPWLYARAAVRKVETGTITAAVRKAIGGETASAIFRLQRRG
jgi:predicted TIM-barrel fold metal-dependent hydrolase